MIQLSAEKRLERSALKIMKEPAFCMWGGLLFVGKRTIVEDSRITATAMVDMEGNTFYNRAFIDALPPVNGKDVHVNFVQLHETAHKACMHLQRGRKLFEANPDRANRAADHVCNLLILEADPQEQFAKTLYLPDGRNVFCRDEKYRGMSFPEVYRSMTNNPDEESQGGKALDKHNIFVDRSQPWQTVKENADKMAYEVEQALRSGSYLASKMGNSGAHRLAGDLLDSQVRWEDEMAEFMTTVCNGEDIATWRRPNRRFVGFDMYLPTSSSEAVGEVIVCLDESGSMTQEEHQVCMTEVVALCRQVRPTRLRLLYWSDGITREEIYMPSDYDSIINVTKPMGGGGTDVEPVARYVNTLEDVQCAIICSDGGIYGSWGEWNVPTLWCLTRKHRLSPVGKTLFLNLEI